MTESSSETNPQILVNGEQREHQQDDAATAEEQSSPVSLDGGCLEDISAAEKEAQEKLQSLFQQVRNQIRSQVGTKAPSNSILELVQRVKDREMESAEMNSSPEGQDRVSSEEKKKDETLTNKNKDEINLKEKELCAVFEEKLETSKKALRAEFEEQIVQVRKEMQAYTDQALKDLECRMQSWKSHNLQRTEQDSKAQDKKQKPPVAPSLASRRGRVLTRTMTDIVPKTCAPVIIGPRAKSETLTSPKGCRFLPRDPSLYLPRSRPHQGRKPFPPSCPPLHQCKKPVQAKAKSGN